MLKLRIDQRSLYLLGGIIAAALSVTSAAAADNFVVAKTAVRRLYPELRDRDLHVAIEDGGLLDKPGALSDFTVAIWYPARGEAFKGPCPAPVLLVRLAFPTDDSGGRVFFMSADGPAVSTDQLAQLTRQVDSHPEWSDSDVLKALTEAGARFGPHAKKELLDAIPTEGLKILLGDVKVKSANFRIRNAAQIRERLPSAILLWVVEIESTGSGPDLQYYLSIEPFNGKLISIERVPPVP